MTATVQNSPGVAEWVRVLRTTDKPQTVGLLHRTVSSATHGAGFCCLGIWCDYLVQKNADSFEVREIYGQTFYDDNSAILPDRAAEALGSNSNHPSVKISNPHWVPGVYNDGVIEVSPEGKDYYRDTNPRWLVNEGVAELNDDARLTFSQIADLVEYAGLD